MLIPNKAAGNTVTHEEINQPFWLKSATYDSVNDRIIVTIGPGRADWGGGTLTEKLSDSTFYITTPAINTTYYIFLQNDSTFVYSTSGVPGVNQIRLASIAVGATKDSLTVTDLRGMIAPIVSNADTVDNYHAGNAAGQVAVSNGTVCSTLNADLLDGSHKADITKLSAIATLVASGSISVAGNTQETIMLSGVAAEHRFYIYSVYVADSASTIAYGAQILPDETVFPGLHSYIMRTVPGTGYDQLVIVNGTASTYTVYYKVYKLFE